MVVPGTCVPGTSSTLYKVLVLLQAQEKMAHPLAPQKIEEESHVQPTTHSFEKSGLHSPQAIDASHCTAVRVSLKDYEKEW
jgi:hypothetical protein